MSDGGCAHVSSHYRLSSIYVWWRLCSCVFTHTDCVEQSDVTLFPLMHVCNSLIVTLFPLHMHSVLMIVTLFTQHRLSSNYVWWRLCSCVFTQHRLCGTVWLLSLHMIVCNSFFSCLMEAVLMCLHTTRLSSIYVWWRLCSCVFTQPDCLLSNCLMEAVLMCLHTMQIVLYLCLMDMDSCWHNRVHWWGVIFLHKVRLSSIYVWWRLCSCVFTQTDCPLSMSDGGWIASPTNSSILNWNFIHQWTMYDGGCAHVSSHNQIVLYLCWWRLCSCVFTKNQIVLYLCLMEAVLMCLHTKPDCPLSMSDGGCADVSSHIQIVLYLCLMEAVLSCVFTQTDCPLSMSDGGCANVSSHNRLSSIYVWWTLWSLSAFTQA